MKYIQYIQYDKSKEILQDFSRFLKKSQDEKCGSLVFLRFLILECFEKSLIPDPRFLILITTLSPIDLKMFHRAWGIVSSFRKNAMTLLWRCQKITKVFASKELMFECWY